jgi:hypothetical protein
VGDEARLIEVSPGASEFADDHCVAIGHPHKVGVHLGQLRMPHGELGEQHSWK